MEKIEIKDLSIEVKRSSRRKTVELTVERDGAVVLHAPKEAALAGLESMVCERLLWIYQQLGRKEEELYRLPAKEFVAGEGFYYRGRKYRLKILDSPVSFTNNEILKLQNGRFILLRQFVPKARETFVTWYTRRAEEWIGRRIQPLQERVGVRLKSMEVRDLGFRWGSCAEKGKLFFHWRIILLPPERIDYLILHELVHIREHSHNAAFYQRLRVAAPDYELHQEWLRENGDRYAL
ncbi:MAG: M48 family metallopeptidase [Syntrophobacteraceae bacterium]